MKLYLKEWRKAHRLTLETLGDRLGKHTSTVQQWEGGRNKVDMDDLAALAKVYDVHPAALLFPPGDRETAARMQAAYEIISNMDQTAAENWLQTGRLLSKEVAGHG